MHNLPLTLIIISYNSAATMLRCQRKLLSNVHSPILIVDNASTDGSAKILQGEFPDAEVIAMKNNIGYGRAANVGLRKTETPYALLLNPDLIATWEEIEKLLVHAKNDTSNTAVWGPASLKKDFTGEPPQSVSWVCGCAMLFDVEKLKTIGLFDENIFLFFEETDLCEQTIKAGYQIKLCRDVYFDHLVSQASSPNPKMEYMKWWHFGWSHYYLMEKNKHYSLYTKIRKVIKLRIKSIAASTPAKRLEWRARADGSLAFIRGEKAFDKTGKAKP